MEFEIELNHSLNIRGTSYPAKKYRIPEDMTKSLANWLLDVQPTVAKRVRPGLSPINLEGPQDLGKVAKEASPSEQKTAFERLTELVGRHLIEIYSDTGSGKSRLVHHIAVEAERSGKKVLYLDTENSLPVGFEKQLKNYELKTAKSAIELLRNLIARVLRARDEKFDMIIVDSIGLPVLAGLSEMSARERGDAFQLMATLRFQMMGFAFEHGLAIGTNQPVSELAQVSMLGKEPKVAEGEPLPPFGGKSEFIAKLILRSEVVKKTPNLSTFKLVVYKARNHGQEYEFAKFTIGDDGVKIEWGGK